MGNTPPADDVVVEGVAGWGPIVTNGVVIARLVREGTSIPPKGALNPMTAIGVDQSGGTLWRVVVDGRQKGYREGMTRYEFACLLLSRLMGARNMDLCEALEKRACVRKLKPVEVPEADLERIRELAMGRSADRLLLTDPKGSNIVSSTGSIARPRGGRP